MNITDKSLQTIFNRVAKHLVNQKVKAFSRSGKMCVCYDEKTGHRCAVGCLMPLKFYQRKNKFISLGALLPQIGIPITDRNELQQKYRIFLNSLQFIHDRCEPTTWAVDLRRFASKYDLKIPEFLLNA